MKNRLTLLLLIVLMPHFASCSSDSIEQTTPPSIEFPGMESGVYFAKVLEPLTITAVVKNAINPKYIWKINGETVSSELSYTFNSNQVGSHYLKFYLSADNGKIEEEIKVEVYNNHPPQISFPIPEEGYVTVIQGESYKIVPNVKNENDASYLWAIGDKQVGTEASYLFQESLLGDYTVRLTVENDFGKDSKEIIIKVVEQTNPTAEFSKAEVSVVAGRTIYLAPEIKRATDETTYSWSVDGEKQNEANAPSFKFKPENKGEYLIEIEVHQGEYSTTSNVKVICENDEEKYYRPMKSGNSAIQNKVYEFLAAPGQLVNEGYQATTMEQANAYAYERLTADGIISLGGFGGYIVVGFDHSIDNISDKKDFSVKGNAYKGSSEPGIIWVMQDENGDGLPNDTWYELKGSETGKPKTIQRYAVTYYRPTDIKMDVLWTDNQGNNGKVEYNQFHSQPYYYPAWVKSDSYTLYGTCLEPRNVNNGGMWNNGEYEWGYADNFGADYDSDSGAIHFDIENVVYPDGTPLRLKHIDFIKVQTAVNSSSGWLGEISTEVSEITDLHNI